MTQTKHIDSMQTGFSRMLVVLLPDAVRLFIELLEVVTKVHILETKCIGNNCEMRAAKAKYFKHMRQPYYYPDEVDNV